jgi:hypothetical protein
MSFPAKETIQALEEFGCLIQNCRQTDWEVTSEKQLGMMGNDTMSITYIIYSGVEVLHNNLYIYRIRVKQGEEAGRRSRAKKQGERSRAKK